MVRSPSGWFLAICAVFSGVTQSVAGYRWPSPQYDALERFLYEGSRRDGSNLASIQHPCKNRPGSQASIGAEWLRLAYHDVATHNSDAGTGGLDASIAFELDRAENLGKGMQDSIEDFHTFPSKYISRADVIAVATVFAVASCGGPIIPLRGGRIDVQSADVPGVPEPHQDLAAHTEMFRRQGFTQEEMIALVACGHTLGGVRSSDFPTIVPPEDDQTAVNFVDFDESHAFDNNVVAQYVDGTTSNALVVGSNATTQSDLRIFSSDNNATMQRLVSPQEFNSTCGTLLEKMINLVPSNVTLTDEITLLPAKVTDAQLTIENDELVFKAGLRLAEPIGLSYKNRTVKIFWCDRYGKDKHCDQGYGKSSNVASNPRVDDPNITPLVLRKGLQFLHYSFVVPIDHELSISTFWFEVDKMDGSRPTRHDNDGEGYKIAQDTILYVPRLSSAALSGAEWNYKSFFIVAAVKNGVSHSRVYMSAFDSAIKAFGPTLVQDVDMALNDTLPAVAGYEFYSGSIEDSGAQLTVDLHVVLEDATTHTEDYAQTFYVGGRAPYTKPTNVTVVGLSPPSTKDSSNSAFSCILDFSYMNAILGLVAMGTLLTLV